jgi:hypothetical protein
MWGTSKYCMKRKEILPRPIMLFYVRWYYWPVGGQTLQRTQYYCVLYCSMYFYM